ncbi:MAG: hypothetical protein LCH54_11285 [Bacteroidetes bacterium]|nr:hypothetical protein [Bacteroidota bacterium]
MFRPYGSRMATNGKADANKKSINPLSESGYTGLWDEQDQIHSCNGKSRNIRI